MAEEGRPQGRTDPDEHPLNGGEAGTVDGDRMGCRSCDDASPISRCPVSLLETRKISGSFTTGATMGGEIHREPPPDIEFPYFKVTYYDQPESVGITVKTTDARIKRWPQSSREFHNDGSINSWQPSDENVEYVWRQKLGELMTDWFLLCDPHLGGMICFPSLSRRADQCFRRLTYTTAHLQPMKGRRRFLIEFPRNYKLFTQTKDGRTDHYLYGTPSPHVCCLGFQQDFLCTSGSKYVAAFRSPQEFFLHACWLITGAEMDSEGFPDCKCKYCGDTRPQKDIDREYQLPGHRDSGHHSGRHGGPSTAATSGAIISQAKDYRNLKKSTTG